MKKKIRYRTVPVQSIDRDKLQQQLESRQAESTPLLRTLHMTDPSYSLTSPPTRR